MQDIYQERNHLIYLLTNSKTKEQYIGQTNNFKSRMYQHSHSKIFTKLFDNIVNYGWLNFKKEILIDGLTQYEADVLEVYYINKFKSELNTQYHYTNQANKEVLNISKTDLSNILNIEDLSTEDLEFALVKNNIKILTRFADTQLELTTLVKKNQSKLKYDNYFGVDLIAQRKAENILMKLLGFDFKDLEFSFKVTNPKTVFKALIKKRDVFIKAGLVDKRSLNDMPADDRLLSSLSKLLGNFGITFNGAEYTLRADIKHYFKLK